jgi:hypothetical protein
MENAPRVVPKSEVTELLMRNLLNDQEEFKTATETLKHGQKNRLIDAMAVYPLQDIVFDESEPELRVAVTVWKRISDSLVAIGTESAIESILASFSQNQQKQENLTEGEINVEQE